VRKVYRCSCGSTHKVYKLKTHNLRLCEDCRKKHLALNPHGRVCKDEKESHSEYLKFHRRSRVPNLPTRYKDFRAVYESGKSFQEIGEQFGCSKERVSQMFEQFLSFTDIPAGDKRVVLHQQVNTTTRWRERFLNAFPELIPEAKARGVSFEPVMGVHGPSALLIRLNGRLCKYNMLSKATQHGENRYWDLNVQNLYGAQLNVVQVPGNEHPDFYFIPARLLVLGHNYIPDQAVSSRRKKESKNPLYKYKNRWDLLGNSQEFELMLTPRAS
jgi:hypothetical protein